MYMEYARMYMEYARMYTGYARMYMEYARMCTSMPGRILIYLIHIYIYILSEKKKPCEGFFWVLSLGGVGFRVPGFWVLGVRFGF